MKIVNGELVEVTNKDVVKGYFEVPSTVMRLGSRCFKKATKLRKLYVPGTVTSCSYSTFDECKFIKEINLVKDKFVESYLDYSKFKIIDINVEDENARTKFRHPRKFKKLNINWEDKSISLKNAKVTRITKTDDTVILIGEDDTKATFITKDSVREVDLEELLNYSEEMLDFLDFRKKYPNIIDDKLHYFYNWIDIMKSSSAIKNNKLPNEYALEAIPFNKKDITTFYISKKKIEELMEEFKVKQYKDKTNFVKMCYILGFFTGNIKDQEKCVAFLRKHERSVDYLVSRFTSADIKNNLYNKEFRDIIIDDYDNVHKNIVYSYGTERNLLSEVYNNFKLLKNECKRQKLDLDFISLKTVYINSKLKVHKGNEELFKAYEEYARDYSIDSFERIQRLYEKAKEVAKLESKKIIYTIDQETDCPYKWLEPTDTNNYFLGNKVGCCAKIGGMGEGILRESVLNSEVANLALYGKKGKIIGKCTAYYNVKEKYILFNNAEVAREADNIEKLELFKALKRAVIDQAEALNKDEIKVKKILIGMTRNDLSEQIFEDGLYIEKEKLKDNLTFIGESGFSTAVYAGDAGSSQCVLWDYDKQKVL